MPGNDAGTWPEILDKTTNTVNITRVEKTIVHQPYFFKKLNIITDSIPVSLSSVNNVIYYVYALMK